MYTPFSFTPPTLSSVESKSIFAIILRILEMQSDS